MTSRKTNTTHKKHEQPRRLSAAGGRATPEASELQPHVRRVSELRRDLVTGSWVVIASIRGKRKKKLIAESVNKERSPKRECPFEDPQASGNGEPLLMRGSYKDWSLQVINNKYPAFAPDGLCIEGGKCRVGCSHTEKAGPYTVRDGYGFHEVVITRDHSRPMALFSRSEAEEVVGAYIERFRILKEAECVKYISVFQNHGKSAGASVYHPHSQIMALPFLPSDIKRSLRGSRSFHAKHGGCPHCLAIAWERKQKVRMVYENKEFVVFCPFVSFGSFEIRIYPKRHSADFDMLPPRQYAEFGDALRTTLRMLHKALGNPPYNFFIHTAPVGTRKNHSYYHWHVEILPKLSVDAGFELGTGVQITIVEPERAASFLRAGKVI